MSSVNDPLLGQKTYHPSFPMGYRILTVFTSIGTLGTGGWAARTWVVEDFSKALPFGITSILFLVGAVVSSVGVYKTWPRKVEKLDEKQPSSINGSLQLYQDRTPIYAAAIDELMQSIEQQQNLLAEKDFGDEEMNSRWANFTFPSPPEPQVKEITVPSETNHEMEAFIDGCIEDLSKLTEGFGPQGDLGPRILSERQLGSLTDKWNELDKLLRIQRQQIYASVTQDLREKISQLNAELQTIRKSLDLQKQKSQKISSYEGALASLDALATSLKEIPTSIEKLIRAKKKASESRERRGERLLQKETELVTANSTIVEFRETLKAQKSRIQLANQTAEESQNQAAVTLALLQEYQELLGKAASKLKALNEGKQNIQSLLLPASDHPWYNFVLELNQLIFFLKEGLSSAASSASVTPAISPYSLSSSTTTPQADADSLIRKLEDEYS